MLTGMGAVESAPLGVDQFIGEHVHTAMWRARITQQQMADALGVDRAAVSRRLRGQTPWKVSDVIAAASLVGVDVAELMPTHEELGHAGGLTRGNAAAESRCTQASAKDTAASVWGRADLLVTDDDLAVSA